MGHSVVGSRMSAASVQWEHMYAIDGQQKKAC